MDDLLFQYDVYYKAQTVIATIMYGSAFYKIEDTSTYICVAW